MVSWGTADYYDSLGPPFCCGGYFRWLTGPANVLKPLWWIALGFSTVCCFIIKRLLRGSTSCMLFWVTFSMIFTANYLKDSFVIVNSSGKIVLSFGRNVKVYLTAFFLGGFVSIQL